MSDTISLNKFVTITYSITDEDNNTLESNDVPVSYIHGRDKQIIEKIEQALEGLSSGDEIQVSLKPHEGFGDYLPELRYTDDINNVPEEFRVVGAEVEFQNDQGESKLFRVTHIADDTLTVDGNHPFAGKTVCFNIRVNEVRDATAAELADDKTPAPALH